jgi:hypothetical protein
MNRTVSFKREHSDQQPASRRPKLRWDLLFKDLSLLISVCTAWLMVSRELRRRRKERAMRLKHIRLVQSDEMKRLSDGSMENI